MLFIAVNSPNLLHQGEKTVKRPNNFGWDCSTPYCLLNYLTTWNATCSLELYWSLVSNDENHFFFSNLLIRNTCFFNDSKTKPKETSCSSSQDHSWENRDRHGTTTQKRSLKGRETTRKTTGCATGNRKAVLGSTSFIPTTFRKANLITTVVWDKAILFATWVE